MASAKQKSVSLHTCTFHLSLLARRCLQSCSTQPLIDLPVFFSLSLLKVRTCHSWSSGIPPSQKPCEKNVLKSVFCQDKLPVSHTREKEGINRRQVATAAAAAAAHPVWGFCGVTHRLWRDQPHAAPCSRTCFSQLSLFPQRACVRVRAPRIFSSGLTFSALLRLGKDPARPVRDHGARACL